MVTVQRLVTGQDGFMEICGLCKSSREMDLKMVGGRHDHGTTVQEVQDDMNKSRSVNKEWEFVSEISLGKFVSELRIGHQEGIHSW